jgi:hypothetical protein
MIRRVLQASCFALFVLCSKAAAQATPLVSPDEIVYRDIERLGALGLIDSLLLGDRPFSERQIVALLKEARANLDRNPAARAWAEPAIAADLARYDRSGQRPIDMARFEAAAMESPTRTASGDALGSIDQDVNAFAMNRGGRPFANGAFALLETSHATTLGKYVAFTIAPRLAVTSERDGETVPTLRLQRAVANVLLWDLAVDVGRDVALFGQSPTGGSMLSTNAPSLDMIRVRNEHEWNVPLLSYVFGGIRGTLIVADLGRERINYPHTKLAAWHLAATPHPQFEIGVGFLDAMGGNGGQAASFGDRVLDVIPLVDVFRTGSDFQFSNKVAGLDLRWRMPRWAGFEMYGEMAVDDIDGRTIERAVNEDAAYLVGASVSCFAECGRYAVRAEYHRTGTRFYTHTHYPLTKSGFVLGDPLGPRAFAGYLSFDADFARGGSLNITGAFEARSGNTYRAVTTGANDAGFHFELVSQRPSEKRARLFALWESDARQVFSLQAGLGVELMDHLAFSPGASRTNWLARIGASLHPR